MKIHTPWQKLVIFLALGFSLGAPQAASASPKDRDLYYGEEFYHKVLKPVRESGNSLYASDAILDKLAEILTQQHLQTPKHFDEIGDCATQGQISHSGFHFHSHSHSHSGSGFGLHSHSGSRCIQHKYQNYKSTRHLIFTEIFAFQEQGTLLIQDAYCGNIRPIPDSKKALGQSLSLEHLWPQSRFSQKHNQKMQKSDMMALLPTNHRTNSIRSSYPFGEVMVNTNTPCDASTPFFQEIKVGYLNTKSRQRFFTPPDLHKGTVARALFYFSARYQLPIDQLQESFLRKWHKEHPVTPLEVNRHEMIFSYQQNRNPFIDYPWLVEQIDNF